ncbi:contact-dependent growth inhibition system immunity protein [Streptomyces pharetrae]|uniref:contact-dependent growth inhibition system immunity protein n=1 Tax=Streptomyces pharetrae TaxID=291370 RepID=UPI00334F3028
MTVRHLIGQDVGLPWLLPVALDFLRETAPEEALTGWYDDDLLSVVLTRKAPVWRESSPAWARHLNQTVGMLTELAPPLHPVKSGRVPRRRGRPVVKGMSGQGARWHLVRDVPLEVTSVPPGKVAASYHTRTGESRCKSGADPQP